MCFDREVHFQRVMYSRGATRMQTVVRSRGGGKKEETLVSSPRGFGKMALSGNKLLLLKAVDRLESICKRLDLN